MKGEKIQLLGLFNFFFIETHKVLQHPMGRSLVSRHPPAARLPDLACFKFSSASNVTVLGLHSMMTKKDSTAI